MSKKKRYVYIISECDDCQAGSNPVKAFTSKRKCDRFIKENYPEANFWDNSEVYDDQFIAFYYNSPYDLQVYKLELN